MKRLIRFLKLWRASVFPFATRTQKAWSVALAIMGLAGPILKWWSNLTWLRRRKKITSRFERCSSRLGRL